MANPFLMNEVDSSQSSQNFSSFNPFLNVGTASDFDQPITASNPFFDVVAGDAGSQDSGPPDVGQNTNPFAAFFATQVADETVSSTSKNEYSIFESAIAPPAASVKSSNVDLLDDIFGGTPSTATIAPPTAAVAPPPPLPQQPALTATQTVPVIGFVTTASDNAPARPSFVDVRRQSLDARSEIPRSGAIDARRKSDVLWSNAELEKRSKVPPARPEPPRRPPPPRPNPPSKETKDLILSVTGALEATSSDLLDRLQATRTPSPTPISELHSPSPTAGMQDSAATDLLGDEIVPPPPPTQHQQQPQPQQQIADTFPTTSATALPATMATATSGIFSADIPQDDFDVFNAIANLPKADDMEESKLTIAPVPPRPPPPLPVAGQQQSSEAMVTDLFDAPIPETVHNVTPFDTSKSFPGQTSIFEQIEENDGQSVLEALSRKSSLLSGPPSPVTESAASHQSRSVENLFDASALPDRPTELIFPSRSRKSSHDGTSEMIQIIPSRKKYSLDFSAGTGPGYVPSVGAADDKILEVPKFPTVMSTTPIISCENIANETLFEESDQPSADQQQAVQQTDTIFQTPTPFPASSPYQQQVQITGIDPFGEELLNLQQQLDQAGIAVQEKPAVDDFDEFEAKFESFKNEATATSSVAFDPFSTAGGDSFAQPPDPSNVGFGNEDTFDEFLALRKPPELSGTEANTATFTQDAWPTNDQQNAFDRSSTEQQPAFQQLNFFDKAQDGDVSKESLNLTLSSTAETRKVEKSDSTETPPTPLFDEDVSQPLEPFPRTTYDGAGWEMQIRYPIRKKFTGQRFWKKVFVRLTYQGETPHLELLNRDDGKETVLHEWPLQPCYAISEIGAQQYDQYGKIFTIKVQFVVYKERPGVRPGQVTKAERLTNKLSQFAAYAIQGDYQGVKEFGSDLKKLGLPVEHSPQISLICKLGSHSYEDMKQFSSCVEEALFRLSAHRDNIHITYKMEEVQITAVDELYVEQSSRGVVTKQIARVRLFFLGFLTGMPDIEVGINDLWRQGKEVVGRHDIIPVVTEEWIRLENIEFHNCVQQDTYEDARTIKFKPPDACYFELMRFRVRPPKNRELPIQLKTTFRITGNKVDIYADILVPGFTSRKLGQIPCEDVAVRIPIPECWIYLFRVEKHFRYGSVKSAHRRTGKIKGIERFLGAVENLEPHLIEVTSGHAKYEHHHRAIVWRMSRLPKEGQGAYTTHNLVCHLALTSFDQIPEELAKYCFVEFTMPVTQVSHTTVRSVSITNSDSDNPPEKYVRHLARHEYRVEIEHTHSEEMADYVAATVTKPAPAPPPKVEKERPPSTDPEPHDSDSDTSG